MKKPFRPAPPPPERIVRGRAPGYESFRARAKAPDWNFWREMRKVKLWQACALTLSIDPDSLKPHPQSWMAGPNAGPIFEPLCFPSKEIEDTFGKRLRLLKDARDDPQVFVVSAAEDAASRMASDDVLLREFASWVGYSGWSDLPAELVEMIAMENEDAAPSDLITLKAAHASLSQFHQSTLAELAMWICLGDLTAWRPTGERFQVRDSDKRDTAAAAVKRIETLNLHVSSDPVKKFDVAKVERWMTFGAAQTLVKKVASDASDEAEILAEWRACHHGLAMQTMHGSGEPQIAAFIPGNAYATRIEDGLVMQSQLAQFLGLSRVVAAKKVKCTTDDNPWLVKEEADPEPEYPWYTPARYFARQLVGEDPALLQKRDRLAEKVAARLKEQKIEGSRGKYVSGPTAKKALTNCRFG